MNDNSYILDNKYGDVNGNGIIDNVYLIGQKTSPDESYAENITIVIQEGMPKTMMLVPLDNAAGYNAQLFLGYFTSNQQMDILVNIDTGGSGGYILTYLYTFKNNQYISLFNSSNFEKNSMYIANFKENFKVEVSSEQNNKTFIIDISSKKKMYIDAGIYSKNGKLLKPTEGGVLGLGALYPIVINYNGLFQLLAFQRIIGIYNADNLGAVQTYLKWDGKRIIVDRVQVAIMQAN